MIKLFGSTSPLRRIQVDVEPRVSLCRNVPFVGEHKRIGTSRGYRNLWRRYLKPLCNIMLREFRTVDGVRILDSIAKERRSTSYRPRRRPTSKHSFRESFDSPNAKV